MPHIWGMLRDPGALGIDRGYTAICGAPLFGLHRGFIFRGCHAMFLQTLMSLECLELLSSFLLATAKLQFATDADSFSGIRNDRRVCCVLHLVSSTIISQNHREHEQAPLKHAHTKNL